MAMSAILAFLYCGEFVKTSNVCKTCVGIILETFEINTRTCEIAFDIYLTGY